MVTTSPWLRRGGVGAGPVQVSRGGEAIAAQAPSAADVSTISVAATQVAAAAASFNETDCYTIKYSATCYPSSQYIPPPEPWDEWVSWGQALVGYLQNAVAAAENAAAAASRVAAGNQAAYYSAQSANSSVGAAQQMLPGIQAQLAASGWTWQSADGSTGKYPLCASYKVNKEEDFIFSPTPSFISSISQALQDCSGAVSYAQQAVKLAQAAMPTPAPSEVSRMSFSSIQRDMLGAPVQVSRETPRPTQAASPCEAWTLGETVFVGQTIFQALQVIPAAVSQLAASGRIGEAVTYLIDGGWYHFQPSGKQVAIYYCSRSPVQVSRPEGVGANGDSTPSATPNASPSATQPPATTGASNAATTGVITGSLIATAVVFTLVAWSLEKGLDKVFSSKK
jgi:hypothetical protein